MWFGEQPDGSLIPALDIRDGITRQLHKAVIVIANCYAYDDLEHRVDNLCGGYIVIFGTGSYIFEGDDTSQDIQSIYGIWDRLGSTTVLKSHLVEQELFVE